MTEIQAVIAKVQLSKVNYIIKKNRINYSILENELNGLKGIKFRKIPDKSKPLYDTLIIQLDSKDKADKLVNMLKDKGLKTKNVPDAIEWHFAKYWDHMLDKIELSKNELGNSLKKSSKIIQRCVAFPIMVRTSESEMRLKSKIIKEIIESL
jgi:8-amino-3,8-dideoxy-alpha-D-manno-octulosonate transaminase